jgi:hypothetical protein
MCAQICEAYSANRYPFPEDQGRRREMNHEVNMRLQELHTTIDAGAWAWLIQCLAVLAVQPVPLMFRAHRSKQMFGQMLCHFACNRSAAKGHSAAKHCAEPRGLDHPGACLQHNPVCARTCVQMLPSHVFKLPTTDNSMRSFSCSFSPVAQAHMRMLKSLALARRSSGRRRCTTR